MENKKFCQYCGKEIDSEAVVCIHCGKQLKSLEGQGKNGPFNKWTAFLLCFFLGA